MQVLLLFALVVGQSMGLTCTKTSTCTCTLSDGVTGTLDFSNVGTMSTTSGDYQYNYDCNNGAPCTGEFGSCGDTGQCSCCQVNTDPSTNFQYGLGQLDPTSFDVSQSNPDSNVWIVKIIYGGGNDDRQFDITFTYDGATQQPSMTFTGESPAKDYHLTAKARFGIPSDAGGEIILEEIDVAGVPGIILLVLLFVAIATYLVVGCLINAFARHKQGVEIIPNVEFWKDFPFLLKDGFVFTFTYPCKKFKEHRTTSYDKM